MVPQGLTIVVVSFVVFIGIRLPTQMDTYS